MAGMMCTFWTEMTWLATLEAALVDMLTLRWL